MSCCEEGKTRELKLVAACISGVALHDTAWALLTVSSHSHWQVQVGVTCTTKEKGCCEEESETHRSNYAADNYFLHVSFFFLSNNTRLQISTLPLRLLFLPLSIIAGKALTRKAPLYKKK